jgi:hypothetical protein
MESANEGGWEGGRKNKLGMNSYEWNDLLKI